MSGNNVHAPEVSESKSTELIRAILERILIRLDAGREAKVEDIIHDLAFCVIRGVSIDAIECEARYLFRSLQESGRTMDPKVIFSCERDELRKFLNDC